MGAALVVLLRAASWPRLFTLLLFRSPSTKIFPVSISPSPRRTVSRRTLLTTLPRNNFSKKGKDHAYQENINRNGVSCGDGAGPGNRQRDGQRERRRSDRRDVSFGRGAQRPDAERRRTLPHAPRRQGLP